MGNEVGRERPSSFRYVSVHDQLATGRKLSILTVVDTYSPAIARGRSPVQLSWRGRGRDAGPGVPEDRLPNDDEGRKRQ